MNILQTCAAYSESKTVDEKTVLRVVGEASPKKVQLMLVKAINGSFMEARDMMYDLMSAYGLSGSEIIRQIHKEMFKLSQISDAEKAELENIVAEYDFRILEGANDDIQLSALLAQFAKLGITKGKSP